MNITLQILVEPATHTLNDPAKASRRFAVGDLIMVFDADEVAPYNGVNHILRDVISTTKFVFVHVRNVPDVNLDVLRENLLASDIEIGTFTEGIHDIIGYYRRKRFNLDINNLPTSAKLRLQADKQITINWSQLRGYLKNLRANSQIRDIDLV